MQPCLQPWSLWLLQWLHWSCLACRLVCIVCCNHTCLSCRGGIRTMVISGDFHHTALATVRDVGMISPGSPIIVIDSDHCHTDATYASTPLSSPRPPALSPLSSLATPVLASHSISATAAQTPPTSCSLSRSRSRHSILSGPPEPSLRSCGAGAMTTYSTSRLLDAAGPAFRVSFNTSRPRHSVASDTELAIVPSAGSVDSAMSRLAARTGSQRLSLPLLQQDSDSTGPSTRCSLTQAPSSGPKGLSTDASRCTVCSTSESEGKACVPEHAEQPQVSLQPLPQCNHFVMLPQDCSAGNSSSSSPQPILQQPFPPRSMGSAQGSITAMQPIVDSGEQPVNSGQQPVNSGEQPVRHVTGHGRLHRPFAAAAAALHVHASGGQPVRPACRPTDANMPTHARSSSLVAMPNTAYTVPHPAGLHPSAVEPTPADPCAKADTPTSAAAIATADLPMHATAHHTVIEPTSAEVPATAHMPTDANLSTDAFQRTCSVQTTLLRSSPSAEQLLPASAENPDSRLVQPLPSPCGLDRLHFSLGLGTGFVSCTEALTALAEGQAQCAVTGAAFQCLLEQPDLAPLETVMRSVIVFARMQPHQKGQAVKLLTGQGLHQLHKGVPRHIQVGAP